MLWADVVIMDELKKRGAIGLAHPETHCFCELDRSHLCSRFSINCIPMDCKAVYGANNPADGPTTRDILLEYIGKTNSVGLVNNAHLCFCNPARKERCACLPGGCFLVKKT